MSARAAHARSTNPAAPRTTPAEHNQRGDRNDKARSAQPVQSPRRESSAQASIGAAPRPSNLKIRAYSAPMVPKSRVAGTEQDHMVNPLVGEPGDDDEIAGDPFFQAAYSFPQSGAPGNDDASSSSADSSSDTEGPMSPTHLKSRQQAFGDSQASPQSPVPSVVVRLTLQTLKYRRHPNTLTYARIVRK